MRNIFLEKAISLNKKAEAYATAMIVRRKFRLPVNRETKRLLPQMAKSTVGSGVAALGVLY
ncbi:MAG: hypothetical protein AAGH79_11545 [Bacteroidota bacterium]